MRLKLAERWGGLHWATRISVLIVTLALFLWQSRYTHSIHNPMFGWPMPFNNVWYAGDRGEWLPDILILDATVWLLLACGVGRVVERCCRGAKRFQFSLRSLFVIQAVAGLMLVLGGAENFLRRHPNNDSIIPAYARMTFGKCDVWLDLGLFTDPPMRGPLTRSTIILAISCAIYSALQLLIDRLVRLRHRRDGPPTMSGDAAHLDPDGHETVGNPLLARLAIWALFLINILMLLTLLAPTVH
jgi:hypothetical protein